MLQREADPLRREAGGGAAPLAGATARGSASLYTEARLAAEAKEEVAARLEAVWQQEQQLTRREAALAESEGAARRQQALLSLGLTEVDTVSGYSAAAALPINAFGMAATAAAQAAQGIAAIGAIAAAAQGQTAQGQTAQGQAARREYAPPEARDASHVSRPSSANLPRPLSARRGRSPPRGGQRQGQPPSSVGWEDDRLADHAQQRDAFVDGTVASFDPRYGTAYEARFDPRSTERRHAEASAASAARAATPWQMQSAFSRLQVANADVDRGDRDVRALREKVASLYTHPIPNPNPNPNPNSNPNQVASLYAKIDGLERRRVSLPPKETREVSRE